MNKLLMAGIVVSLFAALGIGGYFAYQNLRLQKQIASSQSTPSPSPSSAPSPSPKAGWKIYKNDQYGFEFSYPETYKVLTDKDNLYGWPKAILLLYKGGQSYDMAVEVWNTEAEYKTKYVDASSYTVFKTAGGKFITLLNANKDPEVAEIISAFKFLD